MRTFSESLARLAELLPKIDVECKALVRFGFVRLFVYTQKPNSIPTESFEVDTSPHVESHQNAGALERLSDLVHERTGWMSWAEPAEGDCIGFWMGAVLPCEDHVWEYVDRRIAFNRKDHAHVEALILAIEKHLEEK